MNFQQGVFYPNNRYVLHNILSLMERCSQFQNAFSFSIPTFSKFYLQNEIYEFLSKNYIKKCSST